MANIQIQLDDDVKAAADSFFGSRGLNTETVVKEFISTVIATKVIPFELVKKEQLSDNELEEIGQRRRAALGCMKGQIWISDDFDEPLEEMREYME